MLTVDLAAVSIRNMKTTLNIADPVLKRIKAISAKERRSMGAVASELLAEALAYRRRSRARRPFRWISRPMKCLVECADKEGLYAALHANQP